MAGGGAEGAALENVKNILTKPEAEAIESWAQRS